MDETSGPGRKPQVSDEEILQVFIESDDPVLIASEIADQLPIGRRGVYDRLESLHEQGVLERKQVGGRSTVWWYPGLTETSA